MQERGQEVNLDAFTALDAKRRTALQEVETLRNERNTASKEIGERKKNKQDASDLITRMGVVSDRIKELDEYLKQIEEALHNVLMVIPNIPHESVAYGTSSDDNPVVRVWGEKPHFDFLPKPHWISVRISTFWILHVGQRLREPDSPSIEA